MAHLPDLKNLVEFNTFQGEREDIRFYGGSELNQKKRLSSLAPFELPNNHVILDLVPTGKEKVLPSDFQS